MTSSYFNLKPVDTRCILPIELLVAKWSHSITFEPAFLTEWGAVECARQLSFELGTYDGIVRQNVSSLRDLFPTPPHCHGRVRFCDDVEVLVGHDTTICMTGIKIPQNELCHINFEEDLSTIIHHLQCVLSRTDADPLSSLAV